MSDRRLIRSPGAWRRIAAALILSGAIASGAEGLDLRGYGKVAAEFAPDRAVFACESVAKAEILLDKLQADLFWDRLLPVERSQLPGAAKPLTICSLPGYGAALIARSGERVIVLGAADAGKVAALAAAEPLLQATDVSGQAAKPHPRYLDMFDNRAFKTYDVPMAADPRFDLAGRWPFLKTLGASVAFFSPDDQVFPAPGVLGIAQMDYEVREAERQGEAIQIIAYGGGGIPRWAADRFPDSLARPSASTALGAWGGTFAAGAAFESWCTPLAQRTQTGLGILINYMRRYVASPGIAAWSLSCGSPGGEYGFHDVATRTWDTSPTGQEGWRRWLRDERHWSLEDLGRRWYGDPRRFARWDEVRVPDPNTFFGNYGADTYDIGTDWRWKPLTEFPAEAVPAADWIPVGRPPMQQLSFTMRNAGFNGFDVAFDPAAWLKARPAGADVWLVFGIIGTGKDAARVWLNGTPLDLPTDVASKSGPFAVRVTGLVKPGANRLQLALDCAAHATCNGTPSGPVFLSAQEPRRFPYLGRMGNARYADLLDWQCWAVTDYHRQTLDVIRKIDPDRPLIISGGAGMLMDEAARMASDYGLGQENTGREASYSASAPALGAGYYYTSEWSYLTKGPKLERGMGFILFDADASHCLWNNLAYYREQLGGDGWFTPQRRRQIELFGKYRRVQPRLALLRSATSARFDQADSGLLCIDRGELQAAHLDHVVLTERLVQNGQAARYPVLLDTISRVMEPELVEAIRRYVEGGGTFVCQPGTGRHTVTEPDAYPLAALSGFAVLGQGDGGSITFEPKLPIFTGWEGRTFAGRGSAIDWLNANIAQDTVRLRATDPAAVALARWSDGSVAIGYRKIGKGAIIVLGSTFWRRCQDLNGIWRSLDPIETAFLTRLMSDCGVGRDADASVPEVWARKMTTKNGLQDWLMAFNSTPEAETADVWLKTDGTPDLVIDQDSGASVPFTVKDQGVQIAKVGFAAYEVKVFAVRRGTLAGGLPVWWDEKKTYWERTPVQLAAQRMTLPEVPSGPPAGIIPLDTWRFATDPDRALVKQNAWTAPAFNDAAWKTAGVGPWNLLDPALKDYRGTGLYRAAFALPPLRSGQRVLLRLFDRDAPIVHDSGIFHVNGTKVATYQAHGWSQFYSYDVTALIRPSGNVVALEAVAGTLLGGLRGSVWIEAWDPLAPAVDLAGAWQAVQGDWLARTAATVPGSAHGKYLTRTVTIPADWKSRSVQLEWSSKSQWVGSVVIDGMPINFNSYAHPFGTWARIDVTAFLKPGAVNTIEFWPFASMSCGLDTKIFKEQDGLQLDEVRIGCGK